MFLLFHIINAGTFNSERNGAELTSSAAQNWIKTLNVFISSPINWWTEGRTSCVVVTRDTFSGNFRRQSS